MLFGEILYTTNQYGDRYERLSGRMRDRVGSKDDEPIR
jgi:hypothetical protein